MDKICYLQIATHHQLQPIAPAWSVESLVFYKPFKQFIDMYRTCMSVIVAELVTYMSRYRIFKASNSTTVLCRFHGLNAVH